MDPVVSPWHEVENSVGAFAMTSRKSHLLVMLTASKLFSVNALFNGMTLVKADWLTFRLQVDNIRLHTGSPVKIFWKRERWQPLNVWMKSELRVKTCLLVEEAFLRDITEDTMHEQFDFFLEDCKRFTNAHWLYIIDHLFFGKEFCFHYIQVLLYTMKRLSKSKHLSIGTSSCTCQLQ